MIDDRVFLWWINHGDVEEWLGLMLSVASTDKRFVVRYYLGQSEEERFLVVLGNEFPGLLDAGGCWIRLRCPAWESNGAIRPSDVQRLIIWRLYSERSLLRVDCAGRPKSA